MNIKIYTTPTCPYCNQEKEYLQSKGIIFQAIDVSQDEKSRNEMIAKTGALMVPVMVIEKDGKEDIIIGFDKDRLDKLIS